MGGEAREAETYAIRDLCEAFGVTPRALRFYEAQGLLDPKRDGQRRLYGARDRARLTLVLRGKRFGFSLAEIRELLDLYDLGDGQATQLRRTLDLAAGKLESLRDRRRELDAAIDDLERQMALVASLLGAAQTRDAAAAVAAAPPRARTRRRDEPIRETETDR